MKKAISLTLAALVMALTLAACGGGTPSGGDAATPPTTQEPTATPTPTPSATPSPSNTAPPQDTGTTQNASDPVDISELTFNADAISLNAVKNADGTITYTYNDTSIQPSYTSGEAVIFGITIYGSTAESNPITSTNLNLIGKSQGDGTYLVDMTALSGADDVTGESPAVALSDNGLTATWKSGPYEEDGLDKLDAFFVSIGLRVGGESVFSEQVKFGTDILQ